MVRPHHTRFSKLLLRAPLQTAPPFCLWSAQHSGRKLLVRVEYLLCHFE
jgi:hypothetical protein